MAKHVTLIEKIAWLSIFYILQMELTFYYLHSLYL